MSNGYPLSRDHVLAVLHSDAHVRTDESTEQSSNFDKLKSQFEGINI